MPNLFYSFYRILIFLDAMGDDARALGSLVTLGVRSKKADRIT